MKEEKTKWTKAYKKLTKSTETDPVDLTSDGEVSKQSDSVRSKCEPGNYQSGSSSASNTNSERENGSSKDKFLLEKKKEKKNTTSKMRNVKNSPVHSHIDHAINDAYLLSDLRKISQIITKTNKGGQTQKKSKYYKLSPILFLRIQHSTGKKNRQTKNKLVKALVNTGASESIISLQAC